MDRINHQPAFKIGMPVTVEIAAQHQETGIIIKQNIVAKISQIKAVVNHYGKDSYSYGLTLEMPKKVGTHRYGKSPFKFVDEAWLKKNIG